MKAKKVRRELLVAIDVYKRLDDEIESLYNRDFSYDDINHHVFMSLWRYAQMGMENALLSAISVKLGLPECWKYR